MKYTIYMKRFLEASGYRR